MDIVNLEKAFFALKEAKACIEKVRGPSERCEHSFAAIFHHASVVEEELDTIINGAVGYEEPRRKEQALYLEDA